MLDEHGPIPEDLVPLVSFLNTIDLEDGTDELASASGLASWISATFSVSPGKVSRVDAEIARRLRAGLRGLAGHNCGDSVDDAVLDDGELAIGELPIAVRLRAEGPALVSRRRGPRGSLVDVVAAYIRAADERRWRRVKLCASSDCRWAFWDNSKNASRRWCAMARCGSRAKMREYRRRGRG